MANRLGVAHVRDTVRQFSEGCITLDQAILELGVGKSRLYRLRSEFLSAELGDWTSAGAGLRGEGFREFGGHVPQLLSLNAATTEALEPRLRNSNRR